MLPRLRRAEKSAQTRLRSRPTPVCELARDAILLTEDNASVRRVTAKQLTALGYDVVTAANGAEALALLAKHPRVALLLTDIVMPGGMDGIELAQRAAKENPELKVIHMSGFSEGALRRNLMSNALQNLLHKPVRKAELAAKVRETLGARS